MRRSLLLSFLISLTITLTLIIVTICACCGFIASHTRAQSEGAALNSMTETIGYTEKLLNTQLSMGDMMSVTEIAYAVGFNSSSRFSKVFCQFEGVSPQQYRMGKTAGKQGGTDGNG